MRKKILDLNHNLKESFEVRKCNFATILEGKPNKNFGEHLVVCNDINYLIEKMIAHRDIKEENMLTRIGIDGGGGFFKMCFSVFDINEKKEQEGIKKRLEARFLDSGVKKAMIIAIAPNIQEHFVNLKRLWHKASLDKISKYYSVASDLKLLNTMLGLMSHSSVHHCTWCNSRKDFLGQKDEPRKVSTINESFWEFFEARASKKQAKNYGNVIHLNVFGSSSAIEEDAPILLPPPPPHRSYIFCLLQ